MSYTYLQEQGEESSAECFSDIPASVLSRSSLIVERAYFNDNGTESCLDSQFGMISEPSMGNRGTRKSILFRRASRATTSLRRERRLGLMDQSLPCSLRFAESHLRFDRGTCSWKTVGSLWEEVLRESSVSLPAWGMILDGVVWGPVTSEPTTKGFGRGFFPTPCAGNPKWRGTFQEGGGSFNKWRETWLGVQLINPGLWEEIMDWPIGWTDLAPLATDKFQQWLSSHGEHYSGA